MLQLPAPSRWIPDRDMLVETWQRVRARLATERRPAHPMERAFRADPGASALEQQLRPLATRLRRQRTFEALPRQVAISIGVVAGSAVIARLFALPGLFWVALLVAPFLFSFAVWRGARRVVGPFETARRADSALGLRERLATALELLDLDIHGPIADRQVEDATAAAGHVEARTAFPYFAPGSAARHASKHQAAYAAVGLLAIALLVLGPSGAAGVAPWSPTGRELALADPTSDQDNVVRERINAAERDQPGEAVAGRTTRPDEMGDVTPGLVGQNQQNQQNQQGQNGQGNDGQQQQGQQAQRAQQDARSQQSSSVADRQQALQDLASALRQSQTAKQAAESLKRGDTQKASEQLNQVAGQVSKMSPGERQSLSKAFSQASKDIANKDRQLADSTQRAADALAQFRNQDAQQAIREAANEVKDTGQQAQAQKELEQRARDLEKGGQPQLPQGQAQQGQQRQQQGALGQQQQGRQSGQQGGENGRDQQGQQGQSGQLRSGGDSSASSESLSALESELRSAAAGSAGGNGSGSGEGGNSQGAPHRLAVDARLVQVEAEEREGPTQWRPPSPNAPPAPIAPPAAPAAGAPASAQPVGAGQDLNSVPWDLAGSVRQYFTPDTAQAGQK